MNGYRFYWKFNYIVESTGNSVGEAFSKAGYGAGAARALDFYETNKDVAGYQWDDNLHEWVKKQ